MPEKIKITQLPQLAEYTITKDLGIVSGNVVLTANIFKDVWISIRMIFGGEIKFYSQIVAQARTEAIQKMTQQALQLGADAVLSTRIESSSIHPGTIEILAYGTAVKTTKTKPKAIK